MAMFMTVGKQEEVMPLQQKKSVDSYDLKSLSFKSINFEMPRISYRRSVRKMNISLLFHPSVIKGPWVGLEQRSPENSRAFHNFTTKQSTYMIFPFQLLKIDHGLAQKKIIPTPLCSTKRQRRYFQDESFTALPAGKGTVLEIKIRELFLFR